MKKGQLVPDELIQTLMTASMEKSGCFDGKSSFILDGFPRNVKQASRLDGVLKRFDAGLDAVFYINVPESVILSRILDRWVHPPSGRVYNLEFKPPKKFGIDDITGEPLVKRSDDTEAIVRNRLRCFAQDTLPVLDYYKPRTSVHQVNGNTSQEIYPGIVSVLRGMV